MGTPREAATRSGRTRTAGHQGKRRNPTPSIPEEPRLRYLQAAAELATRLGPDGSGAPYVAAGVQMSDVAEELGRSRSGLYRLWDSQEDLWVDLSRYLVFDHDWGQRDESTVPWRAATAALSQLAGADQVTLREALGEGLNLAQDLVLADKGVQLRAALLGYGQVDDLGALRRAVEERRRRDLGEVVALGLLLGNKWVQRPFTPVGAATALWALADGMAVMARFVPEVADIEVLVDDGGGPRPWRLFAYATRALLIENTTADEQLAGLDPPGTTASLAALQQRQLDTWTPVQREVLHAASRQYVRRTAPDAGEALDIDEVRALPQVTMANVAHAAGVSRRTVYNSWASVSDLRLELLQLFLTAEHTSLLTRLDRLTAETAGCPPTAQQLMSTLVRVPPRDRLSPSQARLAFLPEANHPQVRAITRSALRSTTAALADRLEAIWPARERAQDPGLDAQGLAALVLALVHGGERLLRIEPTSLGHNRRPGGPPDPLAVMLDAVLAHRPG